jgi:predicted nucleic acid-binding protein
MAKPSVYVETTVFGYAAARPSRDLIAAARQHFTREWLPRAVQASQMYVSQIVISECSAGDAEAVGRRLALLEGVPLLAVNEAATQLASRLLDEGAVPRAATEDALHIAVAAVHGMDFLVTWNLKHLANAAMRGEIERVCRAQGYEPPVICTPEELDYGDEA